MIILPCGYDPRSRRPEGCGTDPGYGDQWPWGAPFLPSKPYFRDGAVWCAMCYHRMSRRMSTVSRYGLDSVLTHAMSSEMSNDKIKRNDTINRVKGGDMEENWTSASGCCGENHWWVWGGDCPGWPYDGMPCACGQTRYDKVEELRKQIRRLQEELIKAEDLRRVVVA